MEIVLVLGYPASGKSTWLAQNLPGHERLNRDLAGRSLDALVPAAEAALATLRQRDRILEDVSVREVIEHVPCEMDLRVRFRGIRLDGFLDICR